MAGIVYVLGTMAPAPAQAAGVDANTASAAELESVKGLGPALATRIIEERRKRPYRDMGDLQSRVKGIGENNGVRLAQAGLGVGEGRGQVSEAAQPPSVIQLGKGLIREYPAPAQAAAR